MTTDDKMLDELKQIRELLAAKPAPPPPPPKGMWNEFKSIHRKLQGHGLGCCFHFRFISRTASAINGYRLDNANHRLSVARHG